MRASPGFSVLIVVVAGSILSVVAAAQPVETPSSVVARLIGAGGATHPLSPSGTRKGAGIGFTTQLPGSSECVRVGPDGALRLVHDRERVLRIRERSVEEPKISSQRR